MQTSCISRPPPTAAAQDISDCSVPDRLSAGASRGVQSRPGKLELVEAARAQGGEAGDGLYAVHVEYARMSYISPGILEKNISTTTYTTYYYYYYYIIYLSR